MVAGVASDVVIAALAGAAMGFWLPGNTGGIIFMANTLVPVVTSAVMSKMPRLNAPFIEPAAVPLTKISALQFTPSRFSHKVCPRQAAGTVNVVRPNVER